MGVHGFCLRGSIEAQYERVAGSRFEQSQQHSNRGRLASSVRTEPAENLPGFHTKADIIHRREFSKALGQVLYQNGRFKIVTDERFGAHNTSPGISDFSVCRRIRLINASSMRTSISRRLS